MATRRSGTVRDHKLRAANRPAGAHDQGGPHSQPVTQSKLYFKKYRSFLL